MSPRIANIDKLYYITLINAYKPRSTDNATFSIDMQTVLDKSACLSEDVVVCGDLNGDLLHPLANNKQTPESHGHM